MNNFSTSLLIKTDLFFYNLSNQHTTVYTMPVDKKTQTITSTITPPFGDKFQIAAILPIEQPIIETGKLQKIPISIHLSKSGTNTPLGSYIYSIINHRNDEVYQTLLNNSEEFLVDMGMKIGRLISKKFKVPSYVSISGNWNIEELLMTIQLTIKFIQESYI